MLSVDQSISSSGTVRSVGVGVFWDRQCSNRTTSMNWGLLSPGDLKNYVVYLRNNGSVPMRLSIASSNWNPPAASSYFAFAWNSTGVTVNIGSLVPAKLTLAVSSGISGITNFAFDITITGTETQ